MHSYKDNIKTYPRDIRWSGIGRIQWAQDKVWERMKAERLRHYATNWQVASSIPDGVIGIFQ
jgi:hypothetical protein